MKYWFVIEEKSFDEQKFCRCWTFWNLDEAVKFYHSVRVKRKVFVSGFDYQPYMTRAHIVPNSCMDYLLFKASITDVEYDFVEIAKAQAFHVIESHKWFDCGVVLRGAFSEKEIADSFIEQVKDNDHSYWIMS